MANSLPTRLFEVSDSFCSEGEYLVCGILRDHSALSQLASFPKYCAVSHVWGSTIPIKVRSVPWKVPMTSEAKLQRILESCRRLGYTYVWIDTLCINQDDPADSASEMVRMEGYYGNAAATIVFGEKHEEFASKWAKLSHVLDTWQADPSGKLDLTLRVVWNGLGAIDEVMSDGWFWRVWTLQEAVVPLASESSKLLTSEGVQMHLDTLCKLVDWTIKVLALGKLDQDCGEARYNWVHPRQGVVYDRGWCNMLQHLTVALEYKRKTIHPLQILNITRDRECSRAADRLRGAYALVDERWEVGNDEVNEEVRRTHGLDKPETYELTFHVLWQKTVAKYIENRAYDCAPLLTMRVTQFPRRTWDCAPQLPPKKRGGGEWNLETWLTWKGVSKEAYEDWGFSIVQSATGGAQVELGKCTNTTVAITSNGELCLVTSAIEDIESVSTETAFGDGSGERGELFATLIAITNPNEVTYNVSSVVHILMKAADLALGYRDKDEEDDRYHAAAKGALEQGDVRRALEYMCFLTYRDANAFSSALREVFVGWDRWVVSLRDRRAFLVWFPFRDDVERLRRCSLIWTQRGHNDYAVLAEPVGIEGDHCYRKVGIAFVNCANEGEEIEVTFV
ncbi:hypothetical protein ONZ45_g12977 [Pleurotus djamor]|nr:hypothetical protein ONZ45_g12977 [Pleurotus djamor]